MNEFAGKDFAGEDVRDGIVGAVAIKIQDPVFESQTKNKLGNDRDPPWITKEVKEQVITLAAQERAGGRGSCSRRSRPTSGSARSCRRSRSRRARRRARVAIHIPKLIDCKVHYDELHDERREESTIFLTRGELGRRADDLRRATCTRRPSSP